MPLRANRGIVVISAGAGLVLKALYDSADIDKEMRAWAIAQAAGLERHFPRIVDHGESKNGIRWMLAELAPNTNPLAHPINPWSSCEKQYRSLLVREILPMMERFYEASGVEVLDASDLIDEQKEQLVLADVPEPLWKMIRLAEKALPTQGRGRVVSAAIHGDLHSGHVHRNTVGWKLIDWGALKRAEISLDGFKEYFWSFDTEKPKHQAFWAWLRGEGSLSELPRLRADVESFLGWQAKWTSIPASTYALRSALIIHLLRGNIKGALALKLDLEPGGTEKLPVSNAPSSHDRWRLHRTMRQLSALGIGERE